MTITGYIIFILGSFISLLNFYLSFVRYPIYRLCGGTKENYKWVSGIPVFGSVFVLIGIFILFHIKWVLVSGIIIGLLDTAGIHWCIGTLVYYSLFKKNNEG
ncbi:MAG: hypothetical protein ISS71_02415 [Phycisphaerae bacterium]|nr:hypothetical protein [Phycisphaerae bacterium]